jgi:hypothetical protein
VLTFLSGPHACIGFKLSLVEYVLFFRCAPAASGADGERRTNMILHALLAKFDVELALPAERIGASTGVMIRPIDREDVKRGS